MYKPCCFKRLHTTFTMTGHHKPAGQCTASVLYLHQHSVPSLLVSQLQPQNTQTHFLAIFKIVSSSSHIIIHLNTACHTSTVTGSVIVIQNFKQYQSFFTSLKISLGYCIHTTSTLGQGACEDPSYIPFFFTNYSTIYYCLATLSTGTLR